MKLLQVLMAYAKHRYEILKKQALEKGLEKDVEFYLDFFKYGCPPHGGFGIGVDRITMLIFEEGIKDAMFIFRGPDHGICQRRLLCINILVGTNILWALPPFLQNVVRIQVRR